MSVSIQSFTNKSGKEIKYLSIDINHISRSGKNIPVKLGFRKALAVIANADEIKGLLNGNTAI